MSKSLSKMGYHENGRLGRNHEILSNHMKLLGVETKKKIGGT